MDAKYLKKWPGSKNNMTSHNLGASDLPDSFDAREAWPNCESIKEIRDQATCGSCWAFGAAEAMSDRECIHSGQQSQRRVSSEDLLTCCGFSCGSGCNGGWPESAWDFWHSRGLVTGNAYVANEADANWCRPYAFPPCAHHVDPVDGMKKCDGEHPTPSCQRTCASGYSKGFQEDLKKGKSVYSMGSETEMMAELVQNGPFEASFSVYEDFLTYKSGVYRHHGGSSLGGHAIKVIGYGVEGNDKYWLIANSWNDKWGDNGTFKILRGSNECGIENEPVAGLPTTD